MILTRTPLRLSLVGGGTDMPSFYRAHNGAVISTAIDKSIYILINRKFDGRYRISYSKTENVDDIAEIQHDIVREVLKLFQIKGLEIVSVSDIPGDGSGLGSSSAFTVGLLRAMYALCGYSALPRALAEHAFAVESGACGKTVGKQDHYAAACGGIQFYEFRPERVKIENLGLGQREQNILRSNLMLYWTGMRAAGNGSEDILKDQSMKLTHGHVAEEAGLLMAELAFQMKKQVEAHNFDLLGRFIAASWKIKKRFADGISNDWIDQLINNAIGAGASGAKICGAGGGGFLLVVADPACHNAIDTAVGLRRLQFQIGASGSHVAYRED